MAEATALASLASRFITTDAVPWIETAPGNLMKVIYHDPESGMLTILSKLAPGSGIPAHLHEDLEQTYVLEGSLVDKDGPDAGTEVKAGEFVWRPAGSRHSAWAPNGGIFVAIFQIPNKFFEKDGRVLDAAGKDWAATWGGLLAD